MSDIQNTYTLPDLIRDAWRARLFIVMGVALAVIGAFIFMTLTPPQYRAQMTISPANPMNGADGSSLLGDDNAFALRYLVQRVGVANSSDFLRFENKYSGASVAAALLNDDKINEIIGDEMTGGNISAGALSDYITRRVKMSPIGATSMRRMTYNHTDPAFAVYFLERLHMVTDGLIRRQIKTDAAKRIGYLEQTISTTQNQVHRRALATLLMEQERLRMLVSIETPYAAAVIESAAHSVKPVFPNGAVVYPIFAMIGVFFGFVVSGFFNRADNAGIQEKPISAKQWFKNDAANITRKPMTGKRDAPFVHDKRDVG